MRYDKVKILISNNLSKSVLVSSDEADDIYGVCLWRCIDEWPLNYLFSRLRMYQT